MQFATGSVKYGFRNFYKVGAAWWVLTIFYFLLELISSLSSGKDDGFKLVILLLYIFFGFLLFFIQFPYLVIGLSYHRKGEGGLKDLALSKPSLRPYAGACLILAVVMIPAEIFMFLNLENTPFSLFLLEMLAFVIVIYLLIRLFPLEFVVLDRKLDTKSALKYSLELTSAEILSIFTLLVSIIAAWLFYNRMKSN